MAKTEKVNKPTIKINAIPLAVAIDGHSIALSGEGGSLVFFQTFPGQKIDNEIEAVGVVNLRLSIKQFKGLKDALEKTIADHEAKLERDRQKAK